MQNILQNALYIMLTLVYAAIISYFQIHRTNKGKTLPSLLLLYITNIVLSLRVTHEVILK